MIGWQAIFDLWSAPKWCLKGRLFFYGKEKLFFEGLKKCSDLNGFFFFLYSLHFEHEINNIYNNNNNI